MDVEAIENFLEDAENLIATENVPTENFFKFIELCILALFLFIYDDD